VSQTYFLHVQKPGEEDLQDQEMETEIEEEDDHKNDAENNFMESMNDTSMKKDDFQT
jgi:hypothetical protein